MEQLAVEIQNGANAFLPGETVEGTVSWHLDHPAQTVELRLFWYTQGKGDQDVGVVSTVPFGTPEIQSRRPFRVTLPDGPFSFSGKLISLVWALELVVEPGSRSTRTEITVSPTRMEILLTPLTPGAPA